MRQDLIPANLPAKKISPELSPLLRQWLEREPNNDEAVKVIVGNLALREEARAALPVLRAAATQKAGPEGVAEVIGRRMALYPQPARSDGEWGAWWADYTDALADLPWQALEVAMAVWVRDPKSEFMPKPGQLRELALTTENQAIKTYTRAAKAIALAREQEAQVRPPPSPEQIAAVNGLLAGFQEKMAAKDLGRIRTDPPSTAGKPDQGGLTPAMRALVERQRGGQ